MENNGLFSLFQELGLENANTDLELEATNLEEEIAALESIWNDFDDETVEMLETWEVGTEAAFVKNRGILSKLGRGVMGLFGNAALMNMSDLASANLSVESLKKDDVSGLKLSRAAAIYALTTGGKLTKSLGSISISQETTAALNLVGKQKALGDLGKMVGRLAAATGLVFAVKEVGGNTDRLKHPKTILGAIGITALIKGGEKLGELTATKGINVSKETYDTIASGLEKYVASWTSAVKTAAGAGSIAALGPAIDKMSGLKTKGNVLTHADRVAVVNVAQGANLGALADLLDWNASDVKRVVATKQSISKVMTKGNAAVFGGVLGDAMIAMQFTSALTESLSLLSKDFRKY